MRQNLKRGRGGMVLAGGGGAPACGRGGCTGRPVAWQARLAYRLGWLAGAGGLAGMGGRGYGGQRPRPRAGAGEGGRGGTALLHFSWNADCSGKRPRRWLYPALPRHGSGRSTAAPRSVARQGLSTSAVSGDGHRHVRPLSRRHAWCGTGIWPRQGNRRGQKC